MPPALLDFIAKHGLAGDAAQEPLTRALTLALPLTLTLTLAVTLALALALTRALALILTLTLTRYARPWGGRGGRRVACA